MLYPSDCLDAACGSDPGGDPALSGDVADEPAFDDGSSSEDALSVRPQSVLLPRDLTLPLDFELRESGVPGGGLGIWSCRRINVGEILGPQAGGRGPAPHNHTEDFKVGTTQMGNLLNVSLDNTVVLTLLQRLAGPVHSRYTRTTCRVLLGWNERISSLIRPRL